MKKTLISCRNQINSSFSQHIPPTNKNGSHLWHLIKETILVPCSWPPLTEKHIYQQCSNFKYKKQTQLRGLNMLSISLTNQNQLCFPWVQSTLVVLNSHFPVLREKTMLLMCSQFKDVGENAWAKNEIYHYRKLALGRFLGDTSEMKILHQYIHIHLTLITIKKHLSNTSKACKNYLKHALMSICLNKLCERELKIIFSYSQMRRSERELNSPKHSLQLVC